jgi:MFS family permease
MNNFSLNRIILFLTLSDVSTWGIYIVVNTFIGLYLAEKLGVSAIQTVGIGTSVYYFARVISQIPIGLVTDKIRKDRDDIALLFVGNILMGLPYLLFPSISNPSMFYFLQFILGIGGSMNLVNWRKLFATNLSKGSEGLSYAIYDTTLSIAMIFFATVGGYVASISKEYFDIALIVVGLLITSSGFWAVCIFFVKKRKSDR